MAATLLMPRPRPRWSAGKASVMMAEELAKSMAPPTPCPIRMAMSQMAPAVPVSQVTAKQDREDREDGEAEVEDPHPAEDVADPAQGDDQHGQDDHEAHQHPEHVAGVARGQRVEVDPAEDVGQRDEHDRLVDEDHQGAQGHRGQRDPPVAGVSRRQGAAVSVGQGRGAHHHKFNVNVRVIKSPETDASRPESRRSSSS